VSDPDWLAGDAWPRGPVPPEPPGVFTAAMHTHWSATMPNAYPELPALDYERTTVPMTSVIAYLTMEARATEVKRAAYIMFRNESANGQSGVNNNYAGIQADGARWPEKYDAAFAGTVTEPENGTGITRIFLAFTDWRTSVDMLCDRVEARGLYIGGHTHLITNVSIATETDLATAYLREWVHGSAAYQPKQAELANFESMYGQAAALFRGGASPAPAPAASAPAPAPAADNSADALNAAEVAKDAAG
jgi:hypothetical protein